MPTDRNYTNLTLNRTRCEKARANYEANRRVGEPSFNQWVLGLMESANSRDEIVTSTMKDFSHGTITGEGSVIFDRKDNSVIRINVENNELVCSEHKTNPCDHKIFATLYSNWKWK